MRMARKVNTAAMLLCTILALSLGCLRASAAVHLASIFSNHMVLQRGMADPVWGMAKPGQTVKVSFAGNTVSTRADHTGHWMVKLPAMQANAQPQTLKARAGASTSSVEDVLVGEVWLCSGQSNMQYTLNGWTPGGHGHAAVAKAKYPLVRLLTITNKTADFPTSNFQGVWQVCSPQTAGNFSAVGYYYGRDLFRKLHVPIGLISSDWSNTGIRPWTPEFAYRDTPQLRGDYQWIVAAQKAYNDGKIAYAKQIAAWLPQAKADEAAGRPISDPPQEPGDCFDTGAPTSIYNGMIYPLAPFAMRGTIWYQGESNVGDPLYYFRLRAMIAAWRKLWHQGNFPFYIVQIAPFDYGPPETNEAQIWNDQENVVRTVPNTAIAGTMDIATLHIIHPFDKRDVGYRLSLLALAKTYHEKGFMCAGPMYKSMTISHGKAIIHFNYAGDGLVSRNGKPLTWFQIAGKNKKFVPAQATIVGHTVVVQSPQVQNPKVVHFAWNGMAQPNLMNKAGLPALPFATDHVAKDNPPLK